MKASPEDQEALVGGDPQTFVVASHVGRYGWTTIRLAWVDADELRELVVDVRRRTALKRAVAPSTTRTHHLQESSHVFDRASPHVRPRECG